MWVVHILGLFCAEMKLFERLRFLFIFAGGDLSNDILMNECKKKGESQSRNPKNVKHQFLRFAF